MNKHDSFLKSLFAYPSTTFIARAEFGGVKAYYEQGKLFLSSSGHREVSSYMPNTIESLSTLNIKQRLNGWVFNPADKTLEKPISFSKKNKELAQYGVFVTCETGMKKTSISGYVNIETQKGSSYDLILSDCAEIFPPKIYDKKMKIVFYRDNTPIYEIPFSDKKQYKAICVKLLYSLPDCILPKITPTEHPFWKNEFTGEKLFGFGWYNEYIAGGTVVPITRQEYENFPIGISVRGEGNYLASPVFIDEATFTNYGWEDEIWVGKTIILQSNSFSLSSTPHFGNFIALEDNDKKEV